MAWWACGTPYDGRYGASVTATDVNDLTDRLQKAWASGEALGLLGEPARALRDTPHDQPSITNNPYWEAVRLLPVSTMLDIYDGDPHAPVRVEWILRESLVDGPAMVVRQILTRTYAWSIPTPGDLTWIKNRLRSQAVVEIGAGTGYWAWQLRQVGLNVVAYDANAAGPNEYCEAIQYHPVRLGGPADAADHPDRALLLCWPPRRRDVAAEALAAYRGDELIYIGGFDSAVMASTSFFRALEQGWTEVGASGHHVTFDMIHDHVTYWRRNDAC